MKTTQITREMLVEGTHYEIVKDGTGYGYKYAILDHEIWCPKEGIVEIRKMKNNLTVDGRPKNDDEVVIKRFKDRSTDLLFGLHSGVDDNSKQINHTYVKFDGNMMFDLSIVEDRRLYIMAMRGPATEGSPNQMGKPTYKLHDKQIIASVNIDKRKLRRKAEDIIDTLKGSSLEEMARNIGVNVEANKNPQMLLDEVNRIAEANPSKFIEIFESPKREYITIFKRAISKGIITLEFATGNYMYGSIVLGNGEDASVNFLQEKEGMSASIKIQCDGIDSGTKKSMSFVKDEISEIDKLRAELAELKKAKSADAHVHVKSEVAEKHPLKKEDDEELDTLRARAKELKIQGAHLASKDTLLKKIADVEQN